MSSEGGREGGKGGEGAREKRGECGALIPKDLPRTGSGKGGRERGREGGRERGKGGDR